MTNKTLITALPFNGFYNTILAELPDFYCIERIEYIVDIDNFTDENEYFEAYEREFDKLWDSIDFKNSYREIAKKYVAGFNKLFNEHNSFSINLKFKSFYSTNKYNSDTDAIFCEISLKEATKLNDLARLNKNIYQTTVKERFTSYDGFISHYSNNINDWLNKPIEEFDHNELETLLLVAIKILEKNHSFYGNDFIYELEYNIYADYDEPIFIEETPQLLTPSNQLPTSCNT